MNEIRRDYKDAITDSNKEENSNLKINKLATTDRQIQNNILTKDIIEDSLDFENYILIKPKNTSHSNIELFKHNARINKDPKLLPNKSLTPKILIKTSNKEKLDLYLKNKNIIASDKLLNLKYHKDTNNELLTYDKLNIPINQNSFSQRSNLKEKDNKLLIDENVFKENRKIGSNDENDQEKLTKFKLENERKSANTINKSNDENYDNSPNLFASRIEKGIIVQDPKFNFEQSTIEKGHLDDAHEDSMIMNIRNDLDEYNLNSDKGVKNMNIQLALKDDPKDSMKDKIKEFPSDSNPYLCRVCYDGDTEEKGGLISPCKCIGSCKYIHESCLKKWIENNFNNNKIKAECEICKHTYFIKFYMKHKYSKIKLCSCLKSLLSVFLVTGVIMTLIFTVIYVVVSALAVLKDNDKKDMINILIGIGFGLILVISLASFKNCKKNFYEPYMYDWKIFNLDGSKDKF